MSSQKRLDQESAQKSSRRTYHWSPERRRFVRFPCAWKIRFSELNEKQPIVFHHGKCRNLSQGGMKLTSFQALKPKAIVLLEIDFNLFSIHIRLDPLLRINENQIVSKVAWRHLNLDTGLFEVGLEFIKAIQRVNYEKLISKASEH